MPITKSGDFRYIYSNIFSLSMTQHEISVRFGVDEDPANSGKSVFEQVGVQMSHRGFKLFVTGLAEALRNYEARVGEIPIEEKKLASIIKAVQDGTKTIPATDG